MSFQRSPGFQIGFQQLGASMGAATGPSVVLFPSEPLRFRSRWDKTAYAWGVFVRDMRARRPTASGR